MSVLKYMIAINICILASVGGFTYISFSDGYYRDWLLIMVALLGALVSGILTMSGVILTLNRSVDEKAEEKMQSINKLKMLIQFEITRYMESFERELLEQLNSSFVEISTNRIAINKGNCEIYTIYDVFDKGNIYVINDNFSDFLYKLIVEDKNCDLENEFLEFYNAYIKDSDKKEFFSNEIVQLINCKNTIYSNMSSFDKLVQEHAHRDETITEAWIEDKLNRITILINEVEDNKTHYSNKINNLIDYLKER